MRKLITSVTQRRILKRIGRIQKKYLTESDKSLTRQVPDTHTHTHTQTKHTHKHRCLIYRQDISLTRRSLVSFIHPTEKHSTLVLTAGYIFHTNFRQIHKIGYIISNKFCSNTTGRGRGGGRKAEAPTIQKLYHISDTKFSKHYIKMPPPPKFCRYMHLYARIIFITAKLPNAH